MTLFTRDDGAKFELVEHSGGLQNIGNYIIRPVAEPKYLVTDVMESGATGMTYSVTAHFDTTQDQAQLIKQATADLVKYIMGEAGFNTMMIGGTLFEDAQEARQAFQKGAE